MFKIVNEVDYLLPFVVSFGHPVCMHILSTSQFRRAPSSTPQPHNNGRSSSTLNTAAGAILLKSRPAHVPPLLGPLRKLPTSVRVNSKSSQANRPAQLPLPSGLPQGLCARSFLLPGTLPPQTSPWLVYQPPSDLCANATCSGRPAPTALCDVQPCSPSPYWLIPIPH